MILVIPRGGIYVGRESEMVSIGRRKIRIRACQRCGGDGFAGSEEDDSWACLQCGRPVSPEKQDMRPNGERHAAA